MQPIKKAVILAAGYGTRFLPFSKAVPKVMLPIIDTPTIQLIMDELKESGIEEFLIIVGVNKEILLSHYAKNQILEDRLATKPDFLKLVQNCSSYNVKFIEQKNLDGTAGAVLLAKDFTKDEPFLLAYADDLMWNDGKPISKQIIEAYEKTGKTVLACNHVPKADVVKYSSVEYSSQNNRIYTVSRIVEKPKYEDIKSTLSSLGRYILLPNIYSYIINVKPSINGERFITDAFDEIAKNEGAVAYEFEGTRYDIGNKFGYLKATIDYALRNPEYSEKLKEYLKSKI